MSHKIFDDDLEAAIFGNRWKDQLGNVAIAKQSSMIDENYRDTGHIMLFFRHNTSGTLQFTTQINHDWDVGTEIRVHIHVIPMANGSGNVYFTYKYTCAGHGALFPANASWGSGNVTAPILAADQYKHKIISLFSYTPVNPTNSSILLLQITRDISNPADTYETNKDHGTIQANLAALYTDIHYQVIKAGSVTEF